MIAFMLIQEIKSKQDSIKLFLKFNYTYKNQYNYFYEFENLLRNINARLSYQTNRFN